MRLFYALAQAGRTHERRLFKSATKKRWHKHLLYVTNGVLAIFRS